LGDGLLCQCDRGVTRRPQTQQGDGFTNHAQAGLELGGVLPTGVP
jgi:hypothetical protein